MRASAKMEEIAKKEVKKAELERKRAEKREKWTEARRKKGEKKMIVKGVPV